MPLSLVFKPFTSCGKPMLLSDLHSSCLKCLGETHVKDKCQICQDFRPLTKKDRDIRLTAVLMEATLRPVSELSLSDLAPSTLVSG